MPNLVPSRRVLIIEDNLDVAESIRRVLSLKGHVVETAGDGREALALAQTFCPEVVLCDIGLPDIDGYELARRFRADPELQDACLVALSGYATPDEVLNARNAGFDHHVSKPARLDELEEILARPQGPARAK